MPRVKIDYVVSFSSEDPEHPASNLLAREVSKKKWLCKKGESSCSVVLQFAKAVKISSVHIGAYHSALVEVLVARTEKASDHYEVLVPSCVFVNPSESRRDPPVERVRSFSAEQLTEDARHQRWDRLRVVCSQPYNKHCKYGLSFIHIDEAGDDPPISKAEPTAASLAKHHPATSVPQRMLSLDTYSSDEDDFRPGELFAKHLQNTDSQGSLSDTGAQIRQATSQALKNISESSTKLMKTPINKPNKWGNITTTPEASGRADRSRDMLLYTNDDEKPHTKIDQIVQRHKKQKLKENKIKIERKETANESSQKHKEEKRTPKRRKSSSPSPSGTPPSKRANKTLDIIGSSSKNSRDERRSKPAPSEDSDQEGGVSGEPHTLLRGAVLVLSGYENPRRALVRNTALALGAQVLRDWGPTCTHLICAFPNTPKLRAVRAAPGGATVPVATAQWLEQCSARRRLLPWRWFATEPHHRRPPPPPPTHSDCDTDDEIQKVLDKQQAKKDASSDDELPSPAGRRATEEIDEGPSTDEDTSAVPPVKRFGGALHNFFDGFTFAIKDGYSDTELLTRYIKAYGGLTMQLSELDEDSKVDYIVGCAPVHRDGQLVSAQWVANCHRKLQLLPPD